FTLFSSHGPAVADLACDVLAVPVYKEKLSESEHFNALNQRFDGLLGRIAEEERFQGKLQQSLTIHSQGKIAAPRLILVGLGPRAKAAPADLRHAAAKAARYARGVRATSIGLVLPPGRTDTRSIQLAAEGVLLGRYKFDRYLSSDDATPADALERAIFAAGP